VVEFTGAAIAALSVEARMTLCNMTVEAGARGALIAPDAKVFAYVLERAPDIDQDAALADWRALHSDAGAQFDVIHTFAAADVAPYVTWGTSPDQGVAITGTIPLDADVPDPIARAAMAQALRYTGLQNGMAVDGIPVQRVFIGSCTNARIEDLRAVAGIVAGRTVAPGVRAMVVPGSGAVRLQAEREGIAAVLVDAGFEWRQPGCSMCLAMNDDVLAPCERCASTTNRNFEGRQGRGGITHLMSPAMAAAAALTGRITDVRLLEN
jgi:3-isopropylmalate/(R)-2-methylmalate dehydratase large subunit